MRYYLPGIPARRERQGEQEFKVIPSSSKDGGRPGQQASLSPKKKVVEEDEKKEGRKERRREEGGMGMVCYINTAFGHNLCMAIHHAG